MELIQDNIKVEWQDIGEGYNGEYNEEDSHDAPLLRFYFSQLIDGEWQDLDDGSYCTLVTANLAEEDQKKLLQILMDQAFDYIAQDNYKKRLEELSWISADSLLQSVSS